MERQIPRPRMARPFSLPRGPYLLAMAGLLTFSMLGSGCVATGPRQWIRNGFKVGPNYSRPPAPLAAEWIQAGDPRTQGAPPREGNWWEVFQDPTLTALVFRAYEQNPTLRSVGTRVLQARATQAIAVGNFFPQTQAVQGLYPHGKLTGRSTHINATFFNLSWELDFWGKYRRQVESANASLDASVESYDDALVTLLADVATNYVQYRVGRQRIKIAQDNLSSQEKLVALAERQAKVGTTSTLDVEQLKTLVEQTRSSIPALEIAVGQANDRLCVLLGEPPRDLEAELGSGPELHTPPIPGTPASVAAGIPADLLRRRPDVRSAERGVAAQSAQIGVAEADLYPSLSIGTQLGGVQTKLPPLLMATGGLAFLTPQFSWNILNYGRLVNNIHFQDARTQELVATYQSAVLTAAQEVQSALRGFLRSQEQAESLARSAAAAVAATRIEEQLFTDVKADANRLFILLNSRLQAQDQLAVAQGNIALNLIEVYRALGGGWELRLQADGVCLAPGTSTNTQPMPAAPPPASGPFNTPPAPATTAPEASGRDDRGGASSSTPASRGG